MAGIGVYLTYRLNRTSRSMAIAACSPLDNEPLSIIKDIHIESRFRLFYKISILSIIENNIFVISRRNLVFIPFPYRELNCLTELPDCFRKIIRFSVLHLPKSAAKWSYISLYVMEDVIINML